MSHKLIALLGSCIQRYRIVYLVIGRIRNLLVGSVHRRRGSIDQMLNRMLCFHRCTAGFENVIETDDVRLYVYIRIRYRVTNSCLRRKIDYYREMILLKQAVNKRTVGKISSHKLPRAIGMRSCELFDLSETVFLDGNIIVIIHVIQSDNVYAMYGTQKFHNKVGTNKTGCTGY